MLIFNDFFGDVQEIDDLFWQVYVTIFVDFDHTLISMKIFKPNYFQTFNYYHNGQSRPQHFLMSSTKLKKLSSIMLNFVEYCRISWLM